MKTSTKEVIGHALVGGGGGGLAVLMVEIVRYGGYVTLGAVELFAVLAVCVIAGARLMGAI